MKKNYFLTLLLGLFVTTASAQFTKQDVRFWVGSGTDSSVVVIDFKDGSEDSSYAWGFAYEESGSMTFRSMLEAIAAAEPKFSITTSGAFLDDVVFNAHSGLGADPEYWSTWSGDDFASMEMNNGITELLADERWYGLSYGFSNPEAQRPATPWAAYSSLWFAKEDVTYWVGTGADSAVLVIDFVTPNFDAHQAIAYGVKFNGSITGQQMLALVDAADQNLAVDMGQYLNDISYNTYEGNANDPYYWSTFSGTNMSDWTFNTGIDAVITNGGWFGTSYADWPTPRPFIPLPANDPNAVTIDDVLSWVGTGADSAVIVIDFNDGANPESHVFGYLFNGTATGQDALNALNALGNMDIVMAGGYLNDITYFSQSGIGGANGFYWSTWSGENNGNWSMNAGINTALTNGDWFGCSYTNFDPALPPSTPAVAPNTASLNETAKNTYAAYPNPVKDVLHIQGSAGKLSVADVTGKVIYSANHAGFSTVDFSVWNAGMYLISIENNGIVSTQSVVK